MVVVVVVDRVTGTITVGRHSAVAATVGYRHSGVTTRAIHVRSKCGRAIYRIKTTITSAKNSNVGFGSLHRALRTRCTADTLPAGLEVLEWEEEGKEAWAFAVWAAVVVVLVDDDKLLDGW